MRSTSALVLLSAPLFALSKVAIRTYYWSGVLYWAIDTYTGTPSSVEIVAIDSSGNQYDFATGVDTTGSGNLRIFLLASTHPESYRVLVVNPATGETLYASKSFYICESDLAVASSLSLQSASFTHAVTGSVIPYFDFLFDATDTIGVSISLYSHSTGPTNTVVTGISDTFTVPLTQTITGSVSSSGVAATATLLTGFTTTQGAGFGSEPQLHLAPPTPSTTTRSAGFRNTVGGGAFTLVTAVAVGAAMLF